jgi:hypothetical protein
MLRTASFCPPTLKGESPWKPFFSSGSLALGNSFYKERFHTTHLHINRDVLKTKIRERALIEACFKIQQRFVLDNVNATRANRAQVIEAAHARAFV